MLKEPITIQEEKKNNNPKLSSKFKSKSTYHKCFLFPLILSSGSPDPELSRDHVSVCVRAFV